MAGDEFMAYGLAGLQLRWNLFDGFRNREQRYQMLVQERTLAEQRRKLRNEWAKGRRTARLLHARGTAQLEAARASREAARAAAEDLKRQLELGLATEVELMEARNNEARAELVLEQARTLQRLAVLQWRHAAGRELRF
jgi:outer membrane protein TolC